MFEFLMIIPPTGFDGENISMLSAYISNVILKGNSSSLTYFTSLKLALSFDHAAMEFEDIGDIDLYGIFNLILLSMNVFWISGYIFITSVAEEKLRLRTYKNHYVLK